MANELINMFSYINPVKDETVCFPSIDKPSDFVDVFDKAEKSYLDKRSETSKSEIAGADNTKQPSKKVEEKLEENVEVKSDKKIEDYAEDKPKEVDKNTEKEPENNSKTDDKTDKNVSEKTFVGNNVENQGAFKVDEAIDFAPLADANVIVELVFDAQDSKKVDVPQGVEKVQTKGSEQSQTQAQTPISMQPQIQIQTGLPIENFDADVSQLLQDLKGQNAKNNEPLNQVKVQPQAQQVILNLKANEDKALINQAIENKQLSDIKVEVPVIQANADAVAQAANNTANAGNNKQSLKEVLQNSLLTQDMIDKTNATVVKVETSNSSSGNLLNQQNAKEQSIKLSIESLNSLNTTSHTDGTTQASFAKTLDNVQQPKEISKTDILTQINTKFEQIKDGMTTKVTIVLNPENLGKVHLELINGKNGLVASLTAENAQVKEILDKNLDSLRNSLGNQGVNVNNVNVKVAETQKSPEQQMFSFEQNKQEQANQQASGNAKQNTNQNSNYKFSYEDDTVAVANSAATAELSEENAHLGQIDYKI